MSEDTERWLPVAGYEGRYEVSSLGRVRSTPRITTARDGRVYRHRGRILSPAANTESGRLYVNLSRQGSCRTFAVHRLVIETFAGPCPDGMECCHDNGDCTDNRLVNLRWDTHSANIHDKVRHGNHMFANRTHCPAGHPYSTGNTYVWGKGGRSCLTCKSARGRDAYQARLRAATGK